MARVTVEDCLEKVPNRFALTVLASRRARALGESRGTPLVKCSNKPAVTALREIAVGGVRYVEDVDEAMRGYIEEQRAQLRGVSGMDHTFIDAVSFGPIGVDDDDEEAEEDVKELTADLASLGAVGDNDDDDESDDKVVDDDDDATSDDDASDDDADTDAVPGLDDLSDDDDDDDDDDDADGDAGAKK